MNEEYVSPYQLPEFKCTHPKDARDYPALHAVDGERGHFRFPYTGERCPVHNHDCKKETENWREWARWREEYAKPEADDETRQYAMRQMLAIVTPDCPPEADSPKRKVKVKTWHDIDGRPHQYVKDRPSDAKLVMVSVVSVILAVCMLTCFLAILL